MINILVIYGILLPMALVLWMGLILGFAVFIRVILTQMLEVYYCRKNLRQAAKSGE